MKRKRTQDEEREREKEKLKEKEDMLEEQFKKLEGEMEKLKGEMEKLKGEMEKQKGETDMLEREMEKEARGDETLEVRLTELQKEKTFLQQEKTLLREQLTMIGRMQFGMINTKLMKLGSPFKKPKTGVGSPVLQEHRTQLQPQGLVKSEGEFDALQCSDPDFWSIGSDYLMDTNLNINGPFYCRQGVKKLFLFIEEKVIKKSVRGWILGPPGTGKSISSFAFALKLPRNKLVRQFSGPLWPDLENTLNVDDLEAKHEEDVRNNVEEHRVYSWTLKEYLSAVSNETFFNSVKDILDSTIHIQEFDSTVIEKEKIASRNDLVTSKHYFAGGSCRFMFQYSTEVVIKELHECTRSAKDLYAYVDSNMGISSSDVINRLFGCYEQHEYSSVISDFAVRLIACALGPSLVNRMIDFFKAKRNPALHGALLELWFFSSIEADELELYDKKKMQ
ncbi:hypothetical protein EMCRGX_G000363 [Ephydatia muelleri]